MFVPGLNGTDQFFDRFGLVAGGLIIGLEFEEHRDLHGNQVPRNVTSNLHSGVEAEQAMHGFQQLSNGVRFAQKCQSRFGGHFWR